MMSDIKNIDSFADFLSERKEIEQIIASTPLLFQCLYQHII